MEREEEEAALERAIWFLLSVSRERLTMEAVDERREKKCGRREVFIVRWVRKGVGLKTFQSFADRSVINLKI